MIEAFTRGPHNTVLADLLATDAQLLSGLFADLLALLAEGAPAAPPDPLAEELGLAGLGAPAERPDDPALARLFPDAYPDDPQASSEFRRYTQSDLGAERRRRAAAAAETLREVPHGGRLTLDPAQAAAWLGALNDLRLVLGTRLEITADGQEPGEDFDPDDPRGALVPVYYYLGYLQESLVAALSG